MLSSKQIQQKSTHSIFFSSPSNWMNQSRLFIFYQSNSVMATERGENVDKRIATTTKKKNSSCILKKLFPFSICRGPSLGELMWADERLCPASLPERDRRKQKGSLSCFSFLFTIYSTQHSYSVRGGRRRRRERRRERRSQLLYGEGLRRRINTHARSLSLSLLSSWLPAGGKDGKGREGGVSLFSGLEGDSY